MPNTYTQIHIHFVFAVKYRNGVISKNWNEKLYQYITRIIQNNNHKLLCINGMPDHIHILIGLRPSQPISDLMKDVKQSSSKWINQNKFTTTKFECQEGYGAFSYSKSQIGKVVSYIKNQETHHATKTFLEEYKEMLIKFEVDYDEKYIFKELL